MPYSTPVLSGSIPNPATQPLTGDLTWTTSSGPSGNDGSLLLHFDGINGATTFPDTSGVGNTMTASAAVVSTASPKFGTGCGYFAGAGYISTPVTGSGPLDLGAGGDWTIEFWLYAAAQSTGGGDAVLFMINNASNPLTTPYSVYLVNTPSNTINFAGGGLIMVGPNLSTLGLFSTWAHVAVVCASNIVTIYLNGVSYAVSGALTRGTQGGMNVSIGGWSASAGYGLTGYIDELRITQGTAVYTANFTPPTAPFPDGGAPINATGYDIYRNGVSIATVGATLAYIDNVPAAGTYTYNVAAYVSGADASPLSNTVPLTYTGSGVGFTNTIFDEAIFGAYFGGQLNLVEFTYMPGRTPFEEGANNLIINRYKQEPTDTRQRGVDFTQFAVPGEILTGVTVTGISAQGVPQASTSPLVTPLVVTNVVIDPVTQLMFAYSVSGGQNGIEYTIQFTATTSIQTATLEEIFSINIMVEDSFP